MDAAVAHVGAGTLAAHTRRAAHEHLLPLKLVPVLLNPRGEFGRASHEWVEDLLSRLGAGRRKLPDQRFVEVAHVDEDAIRVLERLVEVGGLEVDTLGWREEGDF